MRLFVLLQTHTDIGEHFDQVKHPTIIVISDLPLVFVIFGDWTVFFKKGQAVANTAFIIQITTGQSIMFISYLVKGTIVFKCRAEPA